MPFSIFSHIFIFPILYYIILKAAGIEQRLGSINRLPADLGLV